MQRVRIGEELLHLDVGLSFPATGRRSCAAMPSSTGSPVHLDGWDLIEVSVEQSRSLACNGLPIDPENYILGHNEHEDGGSIRCSTHPFVRRLGAPRG